MATYIELSDPYTNFMQNPARPGPGVCPICRGFPAEGYEEDRGCGFNPTYLDAVVPVSYAPGLGQLHTALRGYKDNGSAAVRRRFSLAIASVLWRFLASHERCVALATESDGFSMVTTVPSKNPQRDDARPHLRAIVGEYCKYTAPRYERILRAAGDASEHRSFDASRFRSVRPIDGDDVLLIDDTWTTGSNAQSAAFTLKEAGAQGVVLVVLARYVNRDYLDHGARLDALPRPFSWDTCAVHR